MEHVVFFPAHDGSPAFRRLAGLEDAVRFVEHLRNNEGVETFSVHSLTEVPLAFKQYFRVELPSLVEEAAEAPATPAVAELEETVETPAETPAEQAGVPVAVQAAVPVLVPEQPEAAAEDKDEAPAAPSLGFFAR